MTEEVSKRIEQLEREISAIHARNTLVETDKAWETSWTRRVCLVVFTYLAVAIYFLFIGLDRAWLNAVVPSVGFLLSTLTLPSIKRTWTKINSKTKT